MIALSNQVYRENDMITFSKQKLVCAVALTLGLLGAVPSHAQYSSDIDLFSAVGGGGSIPNVLFTLDNTANWNADIPVAPCFYKDNGVTTTSGPGGTKKYSIEFCALYNVIDSLSVGANDTPLYNIGFMFFNDTNSGTGARAIKAFTPLNAAGKTALKALIKGWNASAAQAGSPTSYAPSMHEAYLYYTLAQPLYGKPAGLTPPFDPNAFVGTNYTLPVGSNCGKNYIILLANGAPQSDQIANATMKTRLAALGGNTTQITYATGVDPKDADNWTDEYARFMSGKKIITYTVAVTGASSDKPSYPNIFRGIAKEGGGDFYEANSVDSLTVAFGEIFRQLQAENSVFSSASLPVSVNARGTYLNQVFMGMYRPDDSAKPRWRGNLKQYKFNYDAVTDSLFLSDSTDRPAISGATGFISPSAISYWTSSSVFWANQQLGTPLSSSDSPDGEVVEKGGIAQRIRLSNATSQDSRNVYTCVGCSSFSTLSSTPFATATSSITAAMLGVSSATARTDLINWVRGTDNSDDERGPGAPTTIRPSVHGDVLHSRPAVVNYGNGVVTVYYGTNDGMLHAVNGNQTGAGAGSELWSFIPEEHFPKLNRLRSNTPEVRLSTTVIATPAPRSPPTPRDYFVDGPIGVYQNVLSNGATDQVILYVAMRRGGRFLYAIDVTAPSAPKFLWKKTQADISVLGQTWSEPKVARIRGRTNPVIIMGAGYDAVAEDISPQGATTMGNAVLVLDAITGTLVKQFNTLRSVPADTALVDADFDGFVDRAYAVDVGGSIYRIDFEKTTNSVTTFATSDWSMFRFATLTGFATTPRKFFYPPDVVLTPTFAAILAGSGDREKPLATISNDAFFTVFDRNIAKGTPASPVLITDSSLGLVGSTVIPPSGCYIPMGTNGEKIVNAPLTVGGITYFSTNKPDPVRAMSCSSNLGIAKVYSAPLFCNAATSQTLTGGGLPPSAVSGTVAVNYTVTTNGVPSTVTKLVTFVIGAPNTKGSGIEGTKVTPKIIPVRKRQYWFLDNAR